MTPCRCHARHTPRRIVLTGGPGAGKTATLELIRQAFCAHVHVLPEAASIVFGGGFPRSRTPIVLRASQRAIFHVQRELEATTEEDDHAIVLCDRGTIDGLAYWPGTDDMLATVGTSLRAELARYHAVIHLRTPREGYDLTNPLRVETAAEAAAVDARIAIAWAEHPRRVEIAATTDFLAKVARAIGMVRAELPACCRGEPQ